MLQESAVFVLTIELETENGELPTDSQVADMVQSQMAGILDDSTQLHCTNVALVGREVL